MAFKQLLKKLGKNLVAGLYGAIIGMILLIVYCLIIWMPANIDKIGLAIIVIFPLMILIFSIIGIILGAVLGVIIYQFKCLTKKNR